MKKRLSILLLVVCTVLTVQSQTYTQMDANGNITQVDPNNTGNFNPNNRDSIHNDKEVPKGVWAWTVDRRFGDITPTPLDTMPHLYQNRIFATGLHGEYNTIGNNYTARLSRIFIDRTPITEFFFTDPYSFSRVEPESFHFLNTLSPYTNISYDECGNNQHGDDHIGAKFAVNANKRLGIGFDLNYQYGRGYYQNQNVSHFRASIFASYRGDRYQMHLLASAYQHKANENGGIVKDSYITHPEQVTTQYSEEEIPTVLSSNWNRNKSQHVFLTHRYNIGFYRKVKMTDEEIKARQFAAASAKQKREREAEEDGEDSPQPSGRDSRQPVASTPPPTGRPKDARIMGDEPVKTAPKQQPDTTRIRVESAEAMDSLLAEKALQDSIDATMKREYVPVTSIIHTLDVNNYEHIYQAYVTPDAYYLNTYYDGDYSGRFSGQGIYDKHCYTSIKNTFALALLEGFNKYVKAGLKVFASYENRRYKMPELAQGATAYHLGTWNENAFNIGGKLAKTQGHTFHFHAGAELGMVGADAGNLQLDFSTDVNFPLLGDTVRLAAKAAFSRMKPNFFLENFHSKHLWWDQGLNAETRTHLEGNFAYDKTDTHLRVAIDEIQNYTYFGMSYTPTDKGRTAVTGAVYQEATNINVVTLQLLQNLRWGIINWENVVTYQNTSMPSALPLPALNLFSNLYLKFKIARVLDCELGGSMTWFSKYEAPDYLPQIGQFAVQKTADSKVELGAYPFFDVYVNMHLKRARFFLMMTHVNAGSGSKGYFLTPHYPTNTSILHFGVSWNFYN